MSNLIGQHLGPYRILEKIGIGGMATVYKAYQPAMDRYVAVKVIASHFAQDETFLRRFRREARAVAQLEHAHILPVHDYGEAEGRPYLVMRYLEAGTLQDRMAEGFLPLSEVNRIVGQVGSALDYAHRMGVIHRDVKPTNVLLDAEGDTFLTDFGLARMMESSVRLTGTGVGIGTPAYMSPEQGKGAKVDSRSDVYSLGVMLYEMVTGQVPYEAETPLAVVLKHIQEPLPLPCSVRPDLSEEVERVILRAMAKEPDDRFQTAAEMVRALDAAVRASEATARTEPVAEVEPAVAEVSALPREKAVARVGKLLPAGWVRAAVWTAVGGVVLLVLYLVLSRVPLRVQISGGQLEVVRVVEATPALSGAEGATPVEAAAATATPMPQPTATPTPRQPTPTPAYTSAPTEAPLAAPFFPVALNALAVDPNDPDTLFAGTYGAGIYVSHDGGQTWVRSNEGLGKGTVGSILLDPNDSNVIYAGLFDQGGVYKSTDGGQTWTAANPGVNLDNAWNWTGMLYFDPRDSSRLYYSGTTDGLYHSSNGGTTWQQVGGDCPSITGLAIDPSDGEHLYASGYGHPRSTCLAGVYESHDGGRTWERLTTEEMVAPGDEFGGDWFHLAADPKDISTLYAGGQRGVYRSSDGGRSWTPILDQGCDWLTTSEVALYCGRGSNLLISSDGGEAWGEVSYGAYRGGQETRPFTAAPGDPQTLYAGADAIMKSTDGGWTWTRVGGLGAAARMRLTVDPRDGNRLFLSGVDHVGEILRSEDGGETWQTIATNGGWRSRVTIDPIQDVIYLPSPSEDLYRSRDNGQTWERFGSGYVTGGPRQLVPDPQDAKRLWLVSACGTHLSLSEDGGETFAMVESFPQHVCMPILLVHQNGRRMYVVDWGNFHRSDDGGKTWQSPGGLGGIYRAAALDPSNPDVVYVGSTHKGVFKTENGGLTWRQVKTGLTNPSINELAIDPANPQIVYAATDGGAFVSADGGENWSPIQEELGPNPIVYSIAVDPNDSSKVYAVTPDGIFRLMGAPPEGAAAPTPSPGSPADQARAFGDPILAAIAGRPPDYEDGFSDPSSGWPTGSTADGDEWGYNDGAYSISVTRFYLNPIGDCCLDIGVDDELGLSDYVLEVDAQFVSGDWGNWHVFVRDVPATLEQTIEAVYTANFEPDGDFILLKSHNGVDMESVNAYAPTFEQGFGKNRLLVIAQGPQMAFYANGGPFWFVYDELSSRGKLPLALGICNSADATLRVHFDNLRIWDITDLPLPMPTP